MSMAADDFGGMFTKIEFRLLNVLCIESYFIGSC